MIDFTTLKKLNIGGVDLKQLFVDGVQVWKSGYKNLLPEATTTNRSTIFGGDYNGDGTPDGYLTGTRLSSSGAEAVLAGMCCSGFIPAKVGDVLRMKGTAPKTGTSSYVITYDSSNTKVAHRSLSQENYTWVNDTANPWLSVANGVLQVTLDSDYFGTGFDSIRFSAGTISADTIVTINEEIE